LPNDVLLEMEEMADNESCFLICGAAAPSKGDIRHLGNNLKFGKKGVLNFTLFSLCIKGVNA
jgi:hypothetical protein